MNTNNPPSGIRSKVIIGFTVTLLAVCAAAYVAYDSSSKLLNSLTTLSKPGNELRQSSSILALLGEAESNIRIFALSRDYYYFQAYADNITAITRDLASLKSALSNSGIATERIDRITVMLKERYKTTRLYINYIDSTKGNQHTSQAIRKLLAGRKDSLEAKVLSKSTTVTKWDTLTPAGLQKSPNFFDRISNLFKKKAKRKQRHVFPAPQKILAKTQVTSDTNIILKPDTEGVANVNRLLSVMNVQDTQQLAMDEKEINLLRSNALIIEQMMNIVKQIESQQMASRDRNMNQARYIAHESLRVLFMVVFISLVAILLIVFLIFKNVTRSNSYRNQLIEARNQAEKLAKVKEEFLANMSHEIRTPLSAIVGFSEQLAKTDLGQPQKSLLEVVRKSSEHLLLIVNDILDYSRIGAGKLHFEIIPFQEQEVMNGVFETLSGSAKNKGLTLELIVSENGYKAILGDPFRLKQVLLNLVGNAIKFTSTGSVRMESERHLQSDGSLMLQVSISDTGIGIAEDKLSLIFNDFTQADTSSTREFGGSGLGLAISKRLVELQNGNITVFSTPGLGSRFTLSIPCSLASDSPTVEPAKSEDILSLQGKNILLVDDDNFNTLLTRMIFENRGMTVEVAQNGREGIRKFTESDFDLVLTDINMPEVNGIELTRLIRSLPDKRKSAVPIIVFTAQVMKEDHGKNLLEDSNGFLLKPFKENEILAKIQEVLSIAKTSVSNGNSFNPGDAAALYDLSGIRKFAGNKPEMLSRIVQSFVKQSQQDMATLESHAQNQNWRAAADISHKMLTSYGNFGVKMARESLLLLDNQRSGAVNQQASAQAVMQLRMLLNDLIPLLERETGV